MAGEDKKIVNLAERFRAKDEHPGMARRRAINAAYRVYYWTGEWNEDVLGKKREESEDSHLTDEYDRLALAAWEENFGDVEPESKEERLARWNAMKILPFTRER